MKRRRLWYAVLISGFSVLLLTTTTAKPITGRVTNDDAAFHHWGEHVNKTCRTRDCNDTVNRVQLRAIESYMNFTADPCESFHNYACGNWPREHPNSTTMMKIANDQLTANYVALFEDWLTTTKTTTDTTVVVVETFKKRRLCATQNCIHERKSLAEITEISIEDLLPLTPNCKENCAESTTSNDDNNWRPQNDLIVQKMLKYYQVCKAYEPNKHYKLRSYYEIIKSRLQLPKRPENFDWLDTLAEMARFGYASHFLSMKVEQINSSLHRLVIYPHEIEHHVELNSAIFDILSDFTKDNQTTLQERFNALEYTLMQSRCQFCIQKPMEINVNEYMMEEFDCDCYKTEEMTFASLSAQFPTFDWQRYLSRQMGRRIESNEIIEIMNLELIKLHLKFIEEIDIELNLLYTLASFLDYLLEQYNNLKKHTTTELNCLFHMRKTFSLPMSYIYERAIFGPKRAESEKIVQEMFEDLKAEFSLTLQRNKMQFATTILPQLQSKLDNLNVNVGNLPKNMPKNFYDDYIAPYNFTDDFYANHLHALEVFFMNYNKLLDVKSTELKHIWHSFNLHVPYFPDNLDATPYYFARSNLVVIPFNYLQTPFYDANFWPALLYGDLANTLGHEMMHAFDTEFLNYDANGNPNAQPLASMFLNPNFCRNLNCLKEGTQFVRERIADVSGTRLALNTFLKLDPNALKHNGRLYFLQFAQFFCGATDPVTFQLEDPTHDVDSLRLDYVLGVMPEFAEVFNCPLGSGMNPVQKCEMYR